MKQHYHLMHDCKNNMDTNFIGGIIPNWMNCNITLLSPISMFNTSYTLQQSYYFAIHF